MTPDRLSLNSLIGASGPEPGGHLQVSDGFSLGSRTFAPGETFPAHYHTTFEEIFICINGTLRVTVDGRDIDLTSGAKVVIGRHHTHSLTNLGPDPSELVYLRVPFVEDDTVWVEVKDFRP